MTAHHRYRVGRSLGRTIYQQVGDEPSKTDICLGMMDTPELGQMVVDALNTVNARPEPVRVMRWMPDDPNLVGRMVGWLTAVGAEFRHPSGVGATTTLAVPGKGRATPVAEPGDWVVQVDEAPPRFHVVAHAAFVEIGRYRRESGRG